MEIYQAAEKRGETSTTSTVELVRPNGLPCSWDPGRTVCNVVAPLRVLESEQDRTGDGHGTAGMSYALLFAISGDCRVFAGHVAPVRSVSGRKGALNWGEGCLFVPAGLRVPLSVPFVTWAYEADFHSQT